MLVACGGDSGGTADATAGDTHADATATEVSASDAPATDATARDSTATEAAEDGDVDALAPDTSGPADSEVAATDTSGATEVIVVDTEVTEPSSCLDEGHVAGERYPLGDDCNFCDCHADGTSQCSDHTCKTDAGGCSYDGRNYPYAARFSAGDDCNECVCAASGLACTRRCPGLEDISAILLESLDEACGDNPAFTGRAVLDTLPYKSFETAFIYDSDRDPILYPETLPPTTIRVTVAYEEGGYIACRIPSETQPAIDMEATIEMVTADGQFDEGFHTYLRRNDFGFLDAWMFAIGARPDELDGEYDPHCLDPNGFAIGLLIYNSTGMVGSDDGVSDHHAEGDISKVCETDIALTVGTFRYEPPPR